MFMLEDGEFTIFGKALLSAAIECVVIGHWAISQYHMTPRERVRPLHTSMLVPGLYYFISGQCGIDLGRSGTVTRSDKVRGISLGVVMFAVVRVYPTQPSESRGTPCHGIPTSHPSKTHGTHGTHGTRGTHGGSVGHPWVSTHGRLTADPWICINTPMGTHGPAPKARPMGESWGTHERSMGDAWETNGRHTGDPWENHKGRPMGRYSKTIGYRYGRPISYPLQTHAYCRLLCNPWATYGSVL